MQNVTNGNIASAITIVSNGWIQREGSKTASSGFPAVGRFGTRSDRHTLLAAIQRAAGVRLYSSRKGGWFTKTGYTGFGNRKALDALALDYAAKNPQLFCRGPVLGIESLNNQARSKEGVIAFLRYLQPRVGALGTVGTKGIKVKRA